MSSYVVASTPSALMCLATWEGAMLSEWTPVVLAPRPAPVELAEPAVFIVTAQGVVGRLLLMRPDGSSVWLALTADRYPSLRSLGPVLLGERIQVAST